MPPDRSVALEVASAGDRKPKRMTLGEAVAVSRRRRGLAAGPTIPLGQFIRLARKQQAEARAQRAERRTLRATLAEPDYPSESIFSAPNPEAPMSLPIHTRTDRTQLAFAPASLPADRNPALVYRARLSPGSRATMMGALAKIAATLASRPLPPEALDWSALRYQHTAAIRSRLAERYAPATVNKMLAALRGVLREAWRLGQMPAEDYQRAVDLESVRGSTVLRGRMLSPGELKALVDDCRADVGPAGARDAALLAVLYVAGLRRAEAVALDVADLDTKTGELLVRSGKGRKARTTYATNGGMEALRAWIAVRDSAPGALFYRVRRGGHIVRERMTPQAVLDIVRRRAEGASVKRFSPHDLRRTFISELLDAGADLSTARALAGHANVQTTARYDRREERSKKKAAEMLHFPY